MNISRRSFGKMIIKGMAAGAIALPIFSNIKPTAAPPKGDIIKVDGKFIPEMWSQELHARFYREGIIDKLARS